MTKSEKRHRNIRRLAVFCFVIAVVLLLLSYALSLDGIQRSLSQIDEWFITLEKFIARYDVFAAFAILMVLFAFKGVISIVPFSVLFIASGAVFNPFVAIIVNLLGFTVMTSVKFFWGKRFGGGKTHKFLERYEKAYRFLDLKGRGNMWMLVLLQFIPFVPVGVVSRAYGATKMNYAPFAALSLVGFLPRLISWSIVGINIFDPFSPSFIAPIIVLLIISGSSLLVLNALVD